MGRGQNINIHMSLGEVDSNPLADFEVQDFAGGSQCRHGGTAREPELQVEPEDRTELLRLMTKLEQMRSCFLCVSN